jgi:hypothetical protein
MGASGEDSKGLWITVEATSYVGVVITRDDGVDAKDGEEAKCEKVHVMEYV